MKFQWLFWVLVLALGASLPFAVGDLAGGGKETSRPGESRTLAARSADFLREKWISLTGSANRESVRETGAERFEEVAERVRPRLEVELQEKGLEFGAPIFLRIFKESSELEMWLRKSDGDGFELFRIYPICRWSGELGPKLKEGDRQAPEGFYFVSPDRMNPNSRFHLSFDMGFPNEYDRRHGRTGSYLMIHGDCVSIGCYAMTDTLIEEIYTLADAAFTGGQKFFRIHAFPFRMTDSRMEELDENGEWFEFWANLKEGYDYFEMLQEPPDVSLANGRYQFGDSP